jgi:hypothetical protein
MYESAYIETTCDNCDNKIEINQIWTPGGVNDRGGWVVECEKCSKKLHVRIGRDVNDSQMISGGKKIDSYDDELKNKDQILSSHDISE